MLIIITNIVKYTLLYTVDTVKYSMNTEDILEELCWPRNEAATST